MKLLPFILALVCGISTFAGEMLLWNRFWHHDLRQYPDTQIHKYFEDIVYLAAPQGPPPPSRALVVRTRYAGRKPKVLFIIPYADARYPLELAARYPIEYDVLPVSLFSGKARAGKGYRNVPSDFTKTVLDAIEEGKFDVLVTRGFSGDALTPEESSRMENWFRNGMGWVDMGRIPAVQSPKNLLRHLPLTGGTWLRQGCAEPEEEHFITNGTSGLRVSALVKQKAAGKILLRSANDPVLAVRTLERGRLVSHPFGWFHAEVDYALLAKSIFWAAGREPSSFVVPPASRLILSGPLAMNIRGTDKNLRLYWMLVHENGITTRSGCSRVENGRAVIPPHGELPAGNAVLHYSLTAPDRLLDWGAADISLPVRMLSSRIKLPEQFDRARNQFFCGLTVTPARVKDAEFRYKFAFFDGNGRRLPFKHAGTGKVQDGKSTEIECRMPCRWEFLHGPIGFLQISLFVGDRIQELRRIPFFVPNRPADALADWQCGVWGLEPAINVGKPDPWGGLSSTFAPVLRAHGINSVADGIWKYPGDLIPLAREGFHVHTEYLATLFGTWHRLYRDHVFMPKKNYVPPWFENGRQTLIRLTERVRATRKLGIISYACDEEIGLGPGEVCFSPESRRKFEDWVLKKYGSLKGVNQAWGTAMENPGRIAGILLEDALKADPVNPARWMDFRFFMEDCYNGALEDYVRIGSKLAPEAFFGYGAGPHSEIPNQGHNRSRLGKTITSCIEYLGPFFRQGSVFRNFDVLRSRKPRMLISIAGYPYHMVPSVQQYPACSWYTALHGGCGIMYYATIHPSLWGKLHPTGAPNGAAKRIAEANHDLLNGLGKLILNSRRQAGIGIYYSRPSMYAWAWRKARNKLASGKASDADVKKLAEALRDDPGGGGVPDRKETGLTEHMSEHSFAAMRELAAESGFGYDIVFQDQLLSGSLEKQYRILMLPGTLCLSRAEFHALREFVRRGGVVIADMLTGICDESGRRNPLLPEIEAFFGIRRNSPKLNMVPVKAPFGDRPDEMLDGFICEDLSALPSSKPAAGSGHAFFRSFGKGKILYLNTIPKKEGKWGQWAWDPMRISPGLCRLTVQLGISAGLPAPPVSGFPDTDIVTFTRGQELYVFLSRGYQTVEHTATLRLPAPKHVFELRTRKYLGKVGSLQIKTPVPGRTEAYAISNFRTEKLSVNMSRNVSAGTVVCAEINLKFSGPAPRSVILNCSVYTPDGQKEPRLSRNIVWTPEQNRYCFYPTCSEPSGKWRLTVREVAGTAETTVHFELK